MLHLSLSQGEVLWCSPVQSPLTAIVTDEQRDVVVTADSTGLIKTWHGQTGQEVASFSAGSPHCTLVQYNISNNWFLSVSSEFSQKSGNNILFRLGMVFIIFSSRLEPVRDLCAH